MNKKLFLIWILSLFSVGGVFSADYTTRYVYYPAYYVGTTTNNERSKDLQWYAYAVGINYVFYASTIQRNWYYNDYFQNWYIKGLPNLILGWSLGQRTFYWNVCFWDWKFRFYRNAYTSNQDYVGTWWYCWLYTSYSVYSKYLPNLPDVPDQSIYEYPPFYHVALFSWNINDPTNVPKHFKYFYDTWTETLNRSLWDTSISNLSPRNIGDFYNVKNFWFSANFSWVNIITYEDNEYIMRYYQLYMQNSFVENYENYWIYRYIENYYWWSYSWWSIVFHKRDSTHVDFAINDCSVIWDIRAISNNCDTLYTWTVSALEFEEEFLGWWENGFMRLSNFAGDLLYFNNWIDYIELTEIDPSWFDEEEIYPRPIDPWWDWDWDWDWDIGWDIDYTYTEIWNYTTPDYVNDKCWKLNRDFSAKNTYYNQYWKYVFDDSFFWSVHSRPNGEYLTYYDESQNQLLYESKAISSYSGYNLSYSSGDLVNLDFFGGKYAVNYYWKLGESQQKFWLWKIESIDFIINWKKINVWQYADIKKDMWYIYFDMIWYSWSSLNGDLEDLIFDDQTIRYNWVCNNWVYELRDDLNEDVNYFSGADLSYSRQKSMLMTYYHNTGDFYYGVFVPFLEFPTLSWDEIVNYYRASNFWFFVFSDEEVLADYIEDLNSRITTEFDTFTCDSDGDWSVSVLEITLCPITLIWQLFDTAAKGVDNFAETLGILWQFGKVWTSQTLWVWTPTWIVASVDNVFDFDWNRIAMLLKRIIRCLFFFMIIFILFI